MFIIVGAIIVTVSVIGGYMLAKGNLMVLFQPIELIIIGGAALGSLLIANPLPLIKGIIHMCLASLKTNPPSKAQYTELLLCMFEIFKTAKMDMVSLEAQMDKPENSPIFQRYPSVLHNHHIVHFICDTMKVMLSSALSPYDLEDMLDSDIKSMHDEENKIPAAINKVGDAMPGLGIVAAVLGVVLTMGKLTQGKEVIGNSVAAALVGTFLGILFSYGYIAPLASKITEDIQSNGKLFDIVKIGFIAYAKDCNPKLCVEFARRAVPLEVRPNFEEMEQALSGAGKKAA